MPFERQRPATAAVTPRPPVAPRGPAGSPRATFYPGGIGRGGGGFRPQSASFSQRTSFMGPNQVHRIGKRASRRNSCDVASHSASHAHSAIFSPGCAGQQLCRASAHHSLQQKVGSPSILLSLSLSLYSFSPEADRPIYRRPQAQVPHTHIQEPMRATCSSARGTRTPASRHPCLDILIFLNQS